MVSTEQGGGGTAVAAPPEEPAALKRGALPAQDGDEPPEKKPWKGSLTEFKNLVKNGIPKNHLQKTQWGNGCGS